MYEGFLIKSKRHPNGFFSVEDSVLDGFTMKQIIDALHSGEKVIDRWAVERVVKDMLEQQIEDMNTIVQENMDEIIALAYEGREDNPNAECAFDQEWAEKAENLAYDIYHFCVKHNIWIDVCIYYNGKRMSSLYVDQDGNQRYDYNGMPNVDDDFDPKKYFEYVREPNILSMSFEGPLYEILNGYSSPDLVSEFDALFKKYGLYYELGNAWNLSAYEV